jgi:HlyD family secretion protein
VERGRIERVVVATGTIEPEKEVEVRPRISGIVETVHVEAGDLVEEGQPLVEIDRELLEVQVREARARLDEARVELRYARAAFERATTLHDRGTVSDEQHDQASARWEGARAAVEWARAIVDSLVVQLRYATVAAPLTGKILDVDVEEGSAVSSVTSVTGGSRLLTLAAADTLHLEGLVDENEIAHVALGQTARIRTEAFGDRVFEGRVRDIAPLGERQQNVTYFEVEILIVDEGGALLRPRMSGDADIVTEVVDDALLIPETALLYEGEKIYVEAIAPGEPPKLERRILTLGIVNGGRVQVLSGLQADEEIRLR